MPVASCAGDLCTSGLSISSVDSPKHQRVFFVEEPVPTDGVPRMEIHACPESGVNIWFRRSRGAEAAASQETIQKLLLNNHADWSSGSTITCSGITRRWRCPSRRICSPRLTVFDCMDELSAFKDAPQEMKDREAELLRRADLVFTGGQSLYEAKLGRHDDLHVFPSSIEFAHFAQARTLSAEPADQADIPHPRIGFCGVIDERMDIRAAWRQSRNFVPTFTSS